MIRRWLGLGALLAGLIATFTSYVPPPLPAYAAAGSIIVNPNCAASPTPAPSSGQQVTYVDQNGNACTSAAGGGGGAVTGSVSINDGATPSTKATVDSNLNLHVATPNSAVTTGNITSNQSVVYTVPAGVGTFAYDISGTWTGLIVVEVQSYSGGAWWPTTAVPFNSTAVGAFTANSGGQGNAMGVFAVRFRGNTVGSGTAVVNIQGGQGAATIMADNPLQVTQSTSPWVTATGCGTATSAATLTKPFSNGGSASNLLLVSGVSNQKVRICAINIGPAAAAVNVALVEGTTVTNPCDTSTAGMAGGATAALGWQLAANGGLTYGNGNGIVAQAATNADNVCLFFSGAVQVSGVITYAVY